MDPIDQFFNFDDWREFETRGSEHMHTSFHVVDAP